MQKQLSQIKMFVLDMDGTIYLGDKLFPYTKSFLESIKKSGRDFVFFTNNSSKNRRVYVEKLAKLGIEISPEQMLVSNDVIIKWLKENRTDESTYVVGTEHLLEDFRSADITLNEESPDYVVLGFDTSLTYDKLSKACSFIRAGAEVYGVNPDWNCPVENGFIPDCGSIAALVKASTGVQCEFFGKPSRHTLDFITSALGYRQSEIAVVGDRLYTDIAVTQGSDATGILVMTGETTADMLAESDIKPDMIFDSIEVLGKELIAAGRLT